MGNARAIACIGRRKLGLAWEKMYLEVLGARCVEMGWNITTGNAQGSDQCFAMGGNLIESAKVELYLPWGTYEHKAISHSNQVWTATDATSTHIELAKKASSGWNYISAGVKPLLIRNAMLIKRWEKAVEMVYAYPDCTKDGWGGTGHGMRVAASLGIPVWLVNFERYWDPQEGQAAV